MSVLRYGVGLFFFFIRLSCADKFILLNFSLAYSQLAIVASYLGDELVAIYRYFRSLAFDNPLTTARDNLIIAFEKVIILYKELLR